MRRKPGDELAANLKPCEAYVMSDRFRDWAVDRMRSEVGGSIASAGLDRMAILKSKPKDVAPDEEKAEKS